MAKKYQLVAAHESGQSQLPSIPAETDWKICVLCQEETDERITFPGGRKNKPLGHDTLTDKILEFHSLGSIPLNINITRLNNGSGISQTLQSNQGCWHKSCWLLFHKMKLERAKQRTQKRKLQNQYIDNPSPIITRSRLGECSICLCQYYGEPL